MKTKLKSVKIIQIGNSKGIRLPKSLLKKYGFMESIALIELENGVFLKRRDKKLSWVDTYKDMAETHEDWSEFDVTLSDGIELDDFDSETI